MKEGDPIPSSVDIPEEYLEPFDIQTLEIGKIIVWKSRISYYLWGDTIITVNRNPVIMKHNIFSGLHFAVVEKIEQINGDIIITYSDCIRNSNNQNYPVISLDTIVINSNEELNKDLKLPTYYLNIKQ